MAASIADAVIQTLVQKVVEITVQPLVNEADLVFNFKKDFLWVRDELNFTLSYLKDAHQRSIQDVSVKRWIWQLRDFAFDAEDIMDECSAESLYHHKTNKSCALGCSQLIFKHKIGRRIRDLKARMSSIVAEATRLRLFRDLIPTRPASTNSLGAEQWKKSSLLESNARPIGIEAKIDEILRLLNDDAHHVIAVVGMGGVGKTFLLQNVYKDARTKQMFQECIWLSISQTYFLEKLQSDIASTLDLTHVVNSRLTKERAAELIRGSLHGKKFLFVLDDVWRVTEQDSLIEKLGIPVDNTQCKIVITTRSMEVCTVMKASSIYRMEVLKEEDSWNLFCVYAFPEYSENKPPQHLKELARQVESRCGKLPMALKTVGASMVNQTLTEQWESKLQKLKEVSKPEDPIMEILQLSYVSLPAALKLCFLYFAFFEEDEIIEVEYLIELWKAEGFIPEGNDGRKIGFNYFYQLSNVCLIEAWEDKLLGNYCKIHDLLRDLAIFICNENNCGFTLEDSCKKYSSSTTQYLSQLDKSSGCRGLFLAKQHIGDDDLSETILPASLRSLSLRHNVSIQNIPPNLFNKVRSLRVLDFNGTSISRLPSHIGCLKLLKVLNLSGTNIKEVPQCIRSFKNLRVLHMEGRDTIEQIPHWLGELKCLEHLVIDAMSMPNTISELHSLKVLDLYPVELSVEENGLLRLEDVGNLTRLQQLNICIRSEVELQRMKEGVFEHMVNMRRLTVRNDIGQRGDDIPLFPEKLTSMKRLEYLRLSKLVVPSSSWISEFVDLRVLVLELSHCPEYPALESLPNLISLQLRGNNKCRELRESFGKCGSFPKLRYLEIRDFPMLLEFPALEGRSMPCLEEFRLVFCEDIGRVPDGLEQLKNLKLFDFRGSGTDECRARLEEEAEKLKKMVSNPHFRLYV